MATDVEGDWFLVVKGEHLGPVTWAELEEFAKLGGLHPRTDMVWKAGMANWVAAGEIDGLFERRTPGELELGAGGMAVTAVSVGSGVWDNEVDDPHARRLDAPWPGVGRAGYFFANVILPVAGCLGLALLQPLVADMAGPQVAGRVPLLGLGFLLIALYATVMRFPNLGMSRWWTLGLLVPVLSWWVGYRCFACPPGYATNKRLDGIGWVLAVVYWLALVVVIAGTVTVLVMLGAAAANPDEWHALIRRLVEQAGGRLPAQ